MARPPRPPLPQPAAQPNPDRSAKQKRIGVLLCYIVAVIGLVASVIYIATGHASAGGPLLIVPVAAIVVSTLIPKGWRG